MDEQSLRIHQQPWGSAAGLIGGSVTVLGGVIQGVGIYEIILRTCVVFTLVSIVVRTFIWILVAAGETEWRKP